MSEWSDQITEFQRAWVEQQQKMLSDWLDSMKRAGGGATGADWGKAADVMEQQVDSALDAQKQSLLSFAENMENVEGVPEAFTDAVKQLESGIERWTDVQHEMWRVWFDMLRRTSPVPQSPGEAMMKSWEDMVKRTMSVQEEWLSKWQGSQAPSGSASGKRNRANPPFQPKVYGCRHRPHSPAPVLKPSRGLREYSDS